MKFIKQKSWPGSLTGMLLLFFAAQPALAQNTEEAIAGGDVIKEGTASAAITASASEILESTGEGLRFNFRGVPLDTVLDYLGKAAGFTIIRDVEVSGRINAWSYQPLSDEEAVNLLNTILNEMGYAAVRKEKTLRIVSREGARQQGLPVRVGADPEKIPMNDEMVTQIIPLRYIDAAPLIRNLESLVPSYATISANESSNSLILTDTQANIRRVAEIVHALDTSLSNTSILRVFPLKYAKASELADMINRVFQTPQTSRSSDGRRGRTEDFFARMRGEGDEGSSANREGQARSTSRVIAVADERTNSLVVTAPDDLMGTIAAMVDQIDTVEDDPMVMRVFTLQFSDCEEMAKLIQDLFKTDTRSNTDQQRFFGPPGEWFQRSQERRTQSNQEITVTAVADTRTNSVVVSGPSETVEEIGKMVVELDKNPAKDKKVFIHSLENADVEQAANILRGMFNESQSRTQRTNTDTGAFSGLRNTGSTQTSPTRQSSQNSSTRGSSR